MKFVVGVSTTLDLFLRVAKIKEDVFVEAIVAQSRVEAFDERVFV